MYLISENFKRTSKIGKYICNVFLVANLEHQPKDITAEVAKWFGLKYVG
jgi:hypothetical protein